MTSTIETAIKHLSAVPAGKFHQGRFGVTYVYQADESSRRWYGCTKAQLANLGERLERGDVDAYSFWCAETGGADALPFVVTDRDAGCEEHYTVSTMDDAKDCAKRWVEKNHEETGDVVTRLIIVAPDGDEEAINVDPEA